VAFIGREAEREYENEERKKVPTIFMDNGRQMARK